MSRQQWRERRALSPASVFASSRSSCRSGDAMITIESAPPREVSISSAATACAKEIAMPEGFWMTHAITITTGIGLQLVGLYAATVIFGAWITVGLYAIGGLTVLLQRVIAERRVASWSAGESSTSASGSCFATSTQ